MLQKRLEPTCPKCGEDIDVQLQHESFGLAFDQERIRCHCGRCNYKWNTPPLSKIHELQGNITYGVVQGEFVQSLPEDIPE